MISYTILHGCESWFFSTTNSFLQKEGEKRYSDQKVENNGTMATLTQLGA